MKRYSVVALALLFLSPSAWATGWHPTPPVFHPVTPPVVVPPVVKPPVVVAPPVTPPVVTPPAPVQPAPPAPTTPTAPTAPAQQPSQGHGSALGPYVFAGVAIFFYAVICSKEKERGERYTRYMCLDVKLPTQPQVPFDLGFPA